MTTEIVIMNRRAVVLAADSAGTATSFVEGKEEKRYFKGENKVFQLSERDPIGLMTYVNAHLLHTPWDIIVKLFRKEIDRQFDHVEQYADAFFKYVDDNFEITSKPERQAYSDNRLLLLIATLISQLLRTISSPVGHEELKRVILEMQTRVEADPLPERFSQADVDEEISRASSLIKEHYGIFQPPDHTDTFKGFEDAIVRTAVAKSFRFFGGGSNPSGIVVAGYGERQIFPEFVCFDVNGFHRGRLIWSKSDNRAVSANRPGAIESFASNAMVLTFVSGIDEEVYAGVNAAFSASAEDLIKATELSLNASIDERDRANLLATHRSQFMSSWVKKVVDQHHLPLIRVVSMLSIEEMAHLAENLVSLESLKEKMTRSSETVGGPVDVAAITKSEGFVWIRRKLYFDAALNPRYAHRIARMQGGGR